MKRHAFGLIAVILAISFSSLGNSNKLKKDKVYYGVKDGSSYKWVSNQPDLDFYQCVNATAPYCLIIVPDNFTPTDGVVPSSFDLIWHSSTTSVWELIP